MAKKNNNRGDQLHQLTSEGRGEGVQQTSWGVTMYACLFSLFSVLSMLLKENVHINLFTIILLTIKTIQNYS